MFAPDFNRFSTPSKPDCVSVPVWTIPVSFLPRGDRAEMESGRVTDRVEILGPVGKAG